MPGWHQGVRIKGARPRLILASPGTRGSVGDVFCGHLGRVVPPAAGARGAQGCRIPYDAQGSPTGRSLLAATSVVLRPRDSSSRRGCVNALGGVRHSNVSQVCVSTGNAPTGAHVPGEPVCECGCVSGFIPVDKVGEEVGAPADLEEA